MAITAVEFTATASPASPGASLSCLSLRPLHPSPRKWPSPTRDWGDRRLWESNLCVGRRRPRYSSAYLFGFVSGFFFRILFISHPPPSKLRCIWVSKSCTQLCQCLSPLLPSACLFFLVLVCSLLFCISKIILSCPTRSDGFLGML